MKAGDVGEEDRESGQSSSEGDQMQVSLCDVSSEEFNKTWLTLKELHDRELCRLQGKITSLKKERLSDGRWAGSKCRIKELMEQQRALKDTIQDLQGQLNTKVCDRCTVNETYSNMLQQEFYAIQQQNLKFIGELTAERNKLREENKQLLARLKMKQREFHSSFSDCDDFVPGSQTSKSVISTRDSPRGPESHVAVKLITQTNTKQMKSRGKKKQPHSSKFQVPFYSQDVFEVPESPQEISSNRSNPITIRSGSQKSASTVASASTVSPQTVSGFLDDSSLPDATLGHPQRKSIFTQRTSSQSISTPKRRRETDFPWSLSNISTEEDLPTQILSETSEESMIDYSKSIFAPFTRRDENNTILHLFPLDFTSRSQVTRPSCGVFQVAVRESSSETPSSEQSTARKNTIGATGAASDAGESQGETQPCTSGSSIKRKAKKQLEKVGK